MIASGFFGVAPGSEPSSAAAARDLHGALSSWNRWCEQAAVALREGDLDAVDAALASRDALRPRIVELVERMQGAGAAAPEILSALGHLQRTASAADRQLGELLAAQRARVRAELEGLGRSVAHPYASSDGRRRRLDIRR